MAAYNMAHSNDPDYWMKMVFFLTPIPLYILAQPLQQVHQVLVPSKDCGPFFWHLPTAQSMSSLFATFTESIPYLLVQLWKTTSAQYNYFSSHLGLTANSSSTNIQGLLHPPEVHRDCWIFMFHFDQDVPELVYQL